MRKEYDDSSLMYKYVTEDENRYDLSVGRHLKIFSLGLRPFQI